MAVAVHSEKLRELVDEDAEVEQVATGLHVHRGPDLDARRVAPLQRHARATSAAAGTPTRASPSCATRATSATA